MGGIPSRIGVLPAFSLVLHTPISRHSQNASAGGGSRFGHCPGPFISSGFGGSFVVAASVHLLATRTKKFFCLTNQTFWVCRSCAGSLSLKSNRRTSSGTSLEISSRLMFLPMQVRDPAPNCAVSASADGYLSSPFLGRGLHILVMRRWYWIEGMNMCPRNQPTYRHEISLHRRCLLWAFKPTLWAENVGVLPKDTLITMCNPGVYTYDRL